MAAFTGIGNLEAYVQHARDNDATCLTIMLPEFDKLQERIEGLAAIVEAQALAAQDTQNNHEMALAEAEAFHKQQGGWTE